MEQPTSLNSQTGSTQRPRRLRNSAALRRLVRENRFSADQLVMPYFVQSGRNVREEIKAMPGQFRFSPDELLKEIEALVTQGVRSILLFGIPESKDPQGSEAWSSEGVVQSAIREIKKRFKEINIISDVCLCAYTSHGHCGQLNEKGRIDNDRSVETLARVALSHAEAGADIIAPSDMMDGRIRAIRRLLDEQDFSDLPIMSYAAKYASAFYGPFRDAAHSAPVQNNGARPHLVPSDRKTYQMDPANRKEALKEIALDIQEGADIVMVKPALAYLDIIRESAAQFNVPIAAYSVSGEYLMVKSAAESGFVNEKEIVLEMMTSFVRAGASILITYYAKNLSAWMKEELPL